mmetsp:Transcript_10052/g.34712  ORF Transcript_10052/g.34712 Transcript_10052/m.34712 type:complete len:351 (+) Transcript_10052:1263-2315(+)
MVPAPRAALAASEALEELPLDLLLQQFPLPHQREEPLPVGLTRGRYVGVKGSGTPRESWQEVLGQLSSQVPSELGVGHEPGPLGAKALLPGVLKLPQELLELLLTLGLLLPALEGRVPAQLLGNHIEPLHAQPPGSVKVRVLVPVHGLPHLLEEAYLLQGLGMLKAPSPAEDVGCVVQHEHIRKVLGVLAVRGLLAVAQPLHLDLQVLEQRVEQPGYHPSRKVLALLPCRAGGPPVQNSARARVLLQPAAVLDQVRGEGMDGGVLGHRALALVAVLRPRQNQAKALGGRWDQTRNLLPRALHLALPGPAHVVPLHSHGEFPVRVPRRVNEHGVHLLHLAGELPGHPAVFT